LAFAGEVTMKESIHYQKLLDRFYEPLVILKLLLGKQTLGPHLMANHDDFDLNAVRRRFLKNQAYKCDSTKGGQSVASIGLAESNEAYFFWIALNEEEHGTAVRFLKSILGLLKNIVMVSEGDGYLIQEKLLDASIRFSSQRVGKEAKALSRYARNCRKALLTKDDSNGTSITSGVTTSKYS
jgi:hypothetical protein